MQRNYLVEVQKKASDNLPVDKNQALNAAKDTVEKVVTVNPAVKQSFLSKMFGSKGNSPQAAKPKSSWLSNLNPMNKVNKSIEGVGGSVEKQAAKLGDAGG